MTDSVNDQPGADPVLPEKPEPHDPGMPLIRVRVTAGHSLGGIVYTAGDIIETPVTPEVAEQLEAGLLKELT